MTGPNTNLGNNSHAKDQTHSIASDFNALKSDAAHLATDLGAEVSTQTSNAAKALNDTAIAAVRGAETMASTGSAQLQAAVRAQPLTAIAISIGIGALAGAYLRR